MQPTIAALLGQSIAGSDLLATAAGEVSVLAGLLYSAFL
jgi:hypothetical protein